MTKIKLTNIASPLIANGVVYDMHELEGAQLVIGEDAEGEDDGEQGGEGDEEQGGEDVITWDVTNPATQTTTAYKLMDGAELIVRDDYTGETRRIPLHAEIKYGNNVLAASMQINMDDTEGKLTFSVDDAPMFISLDGTSTRRGDFSYGELKEDIIDEINDGGVWELESTSASIRGEGIERDATVMIIVIITAE